MALTYQFPTTMHDPAIERLLQRVRGEFRDMPGLHVTPAQAARLFGVDADLCERLVTRLVETRDLARGADGRISRRESR